MSSPTPSGSSLQDVACCKRLPIVDSGSLALCLSLVCGYPHLLARSRARFGSAASPRTFGDAMAVCPNSAPSAESLASGRLTHSGIWQRSSKQRFTSKWPNLRVKRWLRKHKRLPSQRFRRKQNISTTAVGKQVLLTSRLLPTNPIASQTYMSLPIATALLYPQRKNCYNRIYCGRDLADATFAMGSDVEICQAVRLVRRGAG